MTRQSWKKTLAIVSMTAKIYANQQLSGNVSGEGSKLLGLKWDKVADTLAITFPQERAEPTNREILGKLAPIYDPLGLVSTTTLEVHLSGSL